MFRSISSLLGLPVAPRRDGPSVARAVRAASLTYLPHGALCDLFALGREMERARIEGLFVEAGCALGGSAIVLAAAKQRSRPLHVYDVFDMIPPPSDADGPDVHARYESIRSGHSSGIGGERYYGYQQDLIGTVRANFARLGVPVDRHNVSLIKGLFEDTLRLTEPVALAHIDGDWYDSVTACLTRIHPALAKGWRDGNRRLRCVVGLPARGGRVLRGARGRVRGEAARTAAAGAAVKER